MRAQIADEAVKNGPQPCAVIAVADSENTLWTHVSPGADGVGLDSIFLIASITKPVIYMGAIPLVEHGQLTNEAAKAEFRQLCRMLGFGPLEQAQVVCQISEVAGVELRRQFGTARVERRVRPIDK